VLRRGERRGRGRLPRHGAGDRPRHRPHRLGHRLHGGGRPAGYVSSPLPIPSAQCLYACTVYCLRKGGEGRGVGRVRCNQVTRDTEHVCDDDTRDHWQSAIAAAGPAFVPGDRGETPDEPTSEHAEPWPHRWSWPQCLPSELHVRIRLHSHSFKPTHQGTDHRTHTRRSCKQVQ
jgi:hypothetical protein